MQKYIIASILILFCLPLGLNAQRPINRIIVWDVTRSMIGVSRPDSPPEYGYKSENDIDVEVRKSILKIVDQASGDNEGDIRIIRFRHIVLDNELFPNNNEGREKAKKFIQDYIIYKDNRSFGNTNICGAWERAMEYIDPAKRNIIYLLTDGEQNIANGTFGVECLSHLINTYCNLTQNTDAFTFFVTLDLENNALASQIREACSKKLAIVSVTELKTDGLKELINLRPMFDTLVFNLHDQMPSATQRFEIFGGKLPADFKFQTRVRFAQSLALDVKYSLKGSEGQKSDIGFILEDVSGNTINDLRNKLIGKMYGELVLENATPSNKYITINPQTIPIVIFNKKPQSLNFIVK